MVFYPQSSASFLPEVVPCLAALRVYQSRLFWVSLVGAYLLGLWSWEARPRSGQGEFICSPVPTWCGVDNVVPGCPDPAGRDPELSHLWPAKNEALVRAPRLSGGR